MNIDSIASLITGSIGAIGVLSIFLTLILAGKLHTPGEMRRADETINRLTSALDKNEEALAETRRALAEASARADTSVRSSEVIASAFLAGQARRRDLDT